MKKLILFAISFCFVVLLQAQVSKTLNVTAGGLSSALSTEEQTTVTNLTLTGTIDARDFKTMRDNMLLLAELDLSGVTIVEYTGTEGTSIWENNSYSANAISETAFRNSNRQSKNSLTSITFPTNLTSISNFAFCYCMGLTSITLPSLLSTIGNSAFSECSNLAAINFPSSLITIGDFSFANCHSLTSISIPASVSFIGIAAFFTSRIPISVDAGNAYYSSIDGVLFDKSQTSLMYCPSSKTSLYTIPNSVVIIDSYAFAYCSLLTSVEIPLSVRSIEREAFLGCTGLTFVAIPALVTYIGSNAFLNCSQLNSITVNKTFPVDLISVYNVFAGVDKNNCTLYVPYRSKAAYQAASQWQDFTNIIEATNGFFSRNTAAIDAIAGSIATIDIIANVNWTVTSDKSWLTVSPAEGTDNQMLTFTADGNPSIGRRTATVTISATGYDSKTINITQAGSDTPLEVTAGGLSKALTVEELAGITKLTLNGTIDAQDFKTMRDNMPLL